MSEWQWQVPTYRGSAWENPNHETDLISSEENRINVFCDHSDGPFLFGSFCDSFSLYRFTRRGEDQWWSFSTLYLAGDGTLFPLRSSGSSELHHLQGARVTDLSEFRNENGEVSLGIIDPLQPESEIALIRTRINLRCPECSTSAAFKTDRKSSIQEILRALHSGGVREVSIKGLAGLMRSRLA